MTKEQIRAAAVARLEKAAEFHIAGHQCVSLVTAMLTLDDILSQIDHPDALHAEIARVSRTLGTLIAWMGHTANSPLSPDEAERLLDTLQVRE